MAFPIRRCSVLALLLAGPGGCSAAGSSPAPIETSEAPPSPTGANPGDGAKPGGALSAPGGALTPAAPPPETANAPSACVTVSTAVEIVRQAVDIIIAVDNSGSMDDETRAVEENLNVNFAAILQEDQVDYRMILVSKHREREGQDTAVCIQSPLSTLASCPSEQPGPSDRFFQYSTGIGSSNSFEVLLETYDGRRQDDFGLAPAGWSEWLRPGAKKVFLEISDDNENMDAAEFVSALTDLAPEHFGADPSQVAFVWHSIVGLAQRPIATDPYLASDPIEERECTGNVFNAGTTYQELSRLTGGLRFPICEFEGYDAVFQRIANDVVKSSGGSVCEFAIPEPPEGSVLDLAKVAVAYQAGSGEGPQVFGQVEAASACRANAFVVDDAGVHLCPEACDAVGADEQAAVDVLFTCESTLLR